MVSGRARLAWANRNIEAAAEIIVADFLRELSQVSEEEGQPLRWDDLLGIADDLDPNGAK
jgi:hypothetical protein